MPDHIRAFLEPPRFAAISSIDPDGAPRQTVAWYRIEPDGRLLINSRRGRRWPANLDRDPRLSIAVVDAEDGYRWVGLTGHVEEVIDDVEVARDHILELYERYHGRPAPPETAATYRSMTRVTYLVRITAVHDHLED